MREVGVVRIHEAYGTVEEDEVLAMEDDVREGDAMEGDG